eukprot:jgi/Psemu1/5413/gm1.5413_g
MISSIVNKNKLLLWFVFLVLLLGPNNVIASTKRRRVLRGSTNGDDETKKLQIPGNFNTRGLKMTQSRKDNKKNNSNVASPPTPAPVVNTLPAVIPAPPTPTPVVTAPPAPIVTNPPTIITTPPAHSNVASVATAAPVPENFSPRVPVVGRIEPEQTSTAETETISSSTSSSGGTMSKTSWGSTWDKACPQESALLEQCVGNSGSVLEDCKSCIVSASSISLTDYMLNACKVQFCNGCDGSQYLNCAAQANINKFPVVAGVIQDLP